MKILINYARQFLFLLIPAFICGCSIFTGIVENVSGTYAKGLEQEEHNVRILVVDETREQCFEKILGILKDMGAKNLKVNKKNFIIITTVFRSGLEEVEVPGGAEIGIFLSQENNKTKIRVSSRSSIFLDYAAKKIFAGLEK